MNPLTEKTIETVVREALSEGRLKKIALQAMEDHVLGLLMKEGEKTPPGDYEAMRRKIKKRLEES
jgi:hypothetical protein